MYAEKAFALPGVARLEGDFGRPSLEEDPSTGDLALVAVAKGELVDAKASKPDRLTGVDAAVDDFEDSPRTVENDDAAESAGLGATDGEGLALSEEEEKTF